MLWLFSLLYQAQIYDLSNKKQLQIEYEVQGICDISITFMKGYDIYKINTQIKDKGLAILDLSKSKLIPTRRKPIPIPLTIEGECNGRILNVKIID
ncbi:MAG: hypothetical protein ABIL49_02755 [candidate division WOR-3 bacterium]|jgi:hypothetical protein